MTKKPAKFSHIGAYCSPIEGGGIGKSSDISYQLSVLVRIWVDTAAVLNLPLLGNWADLG